MIINLNELIIFFWRLVCYLDPREGWSHLECGLDVEDWELSSRSKVEISGEDSIKPRQKENTWNYFRAKYKAKDLQLPIKIICLPTSNQLVKMYHTQEMYYLRLDWFFSVMKLSCFSKTLNKKVINFPTYWPYKVLKTESGQKRQILLKVSSL